MQEYDTYNENGGIIMNSNDFKAEKITFRTAPIGRAYDAEIIIK